MLLSISLKRQVAITIIVSAVACILILWFCLARMDAMAERFTVLQERSLPKYQATGNLQKYAESLPSILRALLLSSDERRLATLDSKLAETVSSIEQTLTSLQAFAVEDEAELLSRISTQWTTTRETIRTFESLRESDDKKARRFLIEMVEPTLEKVNADFASLQLSTSNRVNHFVDESVSEYNVARASTITFAVVFISIASFLGFLLSKRINQGIKELLAFAGAIGRGDLTEKVRAARQDEFGEIAVGLNAAISQLNSIITNVDDSISQITNMSVDLQQMSTDTIDAVHQQRSDVTQVATAIAQMNTTFAEVARNANETATRSSQVAKESDDGRTILQDTIDAIESLVSVVSHSNEKINAVEDEAKNIDHVLDVIRNVAEQTNLLALNAAIEAARAGEAGRGFAVVADEVRTLAKRTHSSALEIQNMTEKLRNQINEAGKESDIATEKAKTAVNKANDTETKLERILEIISEINDRMVNVASATEEQVVAAAEIERSIGSVSDNANKSFDVAEKNSQSSSSLASLSEELKQEISVLKLLR